MIRSRLIFILLFLAYLGVTPAGVYTCACLVPAQTTAGQVNLDEISEHASVTDTAVGSLLSFFSLTFLTIGVLLVLVRRKCFYQGSLRWLEPSLFSEPPPTPPPHFA